MIFGYLYYTKKFMCACLCIYVLCTRGDLDVRNGNSEQFNINGFDLDIQLK